MSTTRVGTRLLGAGSVIQSVYAQLTGAGNVTVTNPMTTSGTPPLTQSMGGLILSAAITPKSATSLLRVDCHVQIDSTFTGYITVIGVYRDSGNAVSVGMYYPGNTAPSGRMSIQYQVVAGSTAATTFYLRGGPHATTGSVTFGNQTNSTSGVGGSDVVGTTMTVTEIAA